MSKRMALTLLAGLTALPTTAPAAETVQDVLYYRPTETGFLMHWLVSARHPFDYAYLGATMNYDALTDAGGECSVAPVAGMKAGRGNPWVERHFRSTGWARGVCEFPAASMHMTYTCVYIHCGRALGGLVLLTGSDDALRVVLNGSQVQKVQMQRGYNTDQDRVAGITLKKGWNRLLCKVDDYMGGHGLAVRFKTADGKPVTDLKLSLAMPSKGATARFVDGAKYEADAARLLKDAVRLRTEEGDLAAAEAACRKVAVRYPRSRAAAEALYHAGSFLRQAGKPDDALKTLDDLLRRYPYAKWAEDALLAKARVLHAHRRDAEAAGKALGELLDRFAKSALVPEALLLLADLKTGGKRLDEADAVLARVRREFPDTVEAVQALEALADNQQARKQPNEAKELWRQVLKEAKTLSEGKYVWYVNVQAVLKKVADSARAKLQGRK